MQYSLLKRELQLKFDAIAATNHTLLQMLRMMQSEKAATESRVTELTMVVGQVTTENEALTKQNSQLTQQNEVPIAFDFSCVSLGIIFCMCMCVCTNWTTVLFCY